VAKHRRVQHYISSTAGLLRTLITAMDTDTSCWKYPWHRYLCNN